MNCCITIPIEPMGKARPKATVINGHARVYTPHKTVNYENYIRLAWSDKYQNAEPTKKPIRIIVSFFFSFPKAAFWPKNKNHNGELREEWKDKKHTSKPDIDNALKAVLDGLNKIAYADDSQIYSMTAFKGYALKPRIEIEIITEEGETK